LEYSSGLGSSFLPSIHQNVAASQASSYSNLNLITSQSDWQRYCPDEFRGICAIGFLSKDDGNIDSTQQDIFAGVINKIGTSTTAFKFMVIDGSCYRDFSHFFDVEQINLPTVVAFSAFKRRYAIFKGTFQQVPVIKLNASIVIICN
jgi:hypothetical protein